MTRGESVFKKGKSKTRQCSPMSSSAWCDLNSKGDVFKLHDHCSNPRRKCQKQTTISPYQFPLEGAGF